MELSWGSKSEDDAFQEALAFAAEKSPIEALSLSQLGSYDRTLVVDAARHRVRLARAKKKERYNRGRTISGRMSGLTSGAAQAPPDGSTARHLRLLLMAGLSIKPERK